MPPGSSTDGHTVLPTVTDTAAGTTSYWRLAHATTDQQSNFFSFWGAFGDGQFGVQTDAAGVVPTHRPNGQLPSRSRQWAYCQSGHVLFTPKPLNAPSKNPVAEYGAIYKLNYTNQDAKDSQGFLIKINFDKTNPIQVTISGLSFRDARGAIFFDLNQAVYMANKFTVTNCIGAGLLHGIQLGGGTLTKTNTTGFNELNISYNWWSNMGSSWLCSEGDGFIAFSNSSVHHNVHYKCCQAYSTGGIYSNKMYGVTTNPLCWDTSTKTWNKPGLFIYRNTGSSTAAGNFWPLDGYDFYNEQHSENILWQENLSWDSKNAFIINGAEALSVMFKCIAINKSASEWTAAFNFTNADRVASMHQQVNYCIASGYAYFGTSNENTTTSDLVWKNNVSNGNGKGPFIFSQNVHTVPNNPPPGTTVENAWFNNHTIAWYDYTDRVNLSSQVKGRMNTNSLADVMSKLPAPTNHFVNYMDGDLSALWSAIGL